MNTKVKPKEKNQERKLPEWFVESRRTGTILEASHLKSDIAKAFDSYSDVQVFSIIAGIKTILAIKVKGERTYTDPRSPV